ncbi:hypothetical protein, partial [Ligilactobacillus equi]|uniref:hypothetical protein n=1 Tax=Ligilactobacillus equi TaxID=137357 RepID=UPI001F2603B9
MGFLVHLNVQLIFYNLSNLKNSRIISFEKNIFQQRCANLISGVIRGSLFLSLGYNFLPIIFSYFL